MGSEPGQNRVGIGSESSRNRVGLREPREPATPEMAALRSSSGARPSDSRAADRVGPARSPSRMLAVAASGLRHDSSSRLGEGSLVVYYARRVPFACSIINILPSHSVMSQSESSQKTINFEYMNSGSSAAELSEIH